MPANNTNKHDELIYKDECYQIYGLLFKLQNELGTNFQEKHYQRAFEDLLKAENIPYKREVSLEINYGEKFLGKFSVDFIVWNKIVLEFKTVPSLNQEYLKQTLRYLETLDLKLGLIVNFRERPLKPMRVINSKV